MSTTTDNGYSSVPLKLPLLLGIFRTNVNYPESGVGQTTSRTRLKHVMVRFLHFRQKSKMALLLNLMSLFLFASALWVSQFEYVLGLGLICFTGFLFLFLKAQQERQACYALLEKSVRSSHLLMVLPDILMYAWAHYRLDKQMRRLITGALDESGLVRP